MGTPGGGAGTGPEQDPSPGAQSPAAGASGPGTRVDLTQDEPGALPVPLATEVVGPTATLADWTRVALAGSLVGLLIILTLGTGWFAVDYPGKEKYIESFLKLVFTPIVGLVGSVVGFYFGSRATSSN